MDKISHQQPQNILFIEFVSKVSGAEVCLLNLLRRLDKAQFRPIVVCPEEGPLTDAMRDSGIEFRIVKMSRLTRYSIRSMLSYIVNYATVVYHLVRIIREENIALVHAFIYMVFKYACPAAWLAGVPIIGSMHDALIPERVPRLKRWIVVFLINRFLNLLLCVSDAIKTITIAQGANPLKIRTLYNGIDYQEIEAQANADYPSDVRSELGLAHDTFLIGSVGRLTEWKGFQYMIKAMKEVLHYIPQARYVIVGDAFVDDDEWAGQLRNLPRELGLLKEVVFTGWRQDVPRIMKELDCFILPSALPDPFPTVILEAMALGIPIVATSVGGVPEMLADGECGILVEPRSSHSLAQAIIDLYNDNQRAQEIARNAQRRLRENFTLERHVENMTQVYRELIRMEER